jgi:hypothetical protein
LRQPFTELAGNGRKACSARAFIFPYISLAGRKYEQHGFNTTSSFYLLSLTKIIWNLTKTIPYLCGSYDSIKKRTVPRTKFIIIISILLSGVSCMQNMNEDPKTGDYDTETLPVSLDEEGFDDAKASDCTVSGTLSYNSELDRWEIRNSPANTIDEVNVYVVKNYEIELPKDTRKNVQATGRCYQSPERTGIPAGTTIYYISVKTLNNE